MVGVVARSRSCLVPDPRPLRDPTRAFSGEEQGSGHRAKFPRPGNTRRRCSKKVAAWRAFRRLVAVGSLAGWRKGRASQGMLQQLVNLLASISSPRSQVSCFSSSFTHSKQSTLRQRTRHVAGGSGRRKLARVLREHRMASPRLASMPAMAKGWQGRSSWSKWRHGCRCGWIRAEPTPSSSPTRRTWESRDLHSKRSTMCARHHDGVEAQAGGHRTIGLTVAPLRVLSRKAAGAAVGERAAAIRSFLVTRSDQVLRARRARPPLGRRPLNQVPHTTVGLLVRHVAPLFLFGPFGPFFQVAVGQQRRQNSCWQPFWKQWNTVDDISGHVAGYPQDGVSPHSRGGQVFGGRPPERDLPLSKGKSTHRRSGQAQACPFAAVGGVRDRRVRCGTQRGGRFCSWAGGDGRSSSRASW